MAATLNVASPDQRLSPSAAAPHPAVHEFAQGLDGVQPAAEVVDMATEIVQVALDRLVEPEFSVDVDGALFFDLRLTNGLLLFAELAVDGSLDVRVYDDRAASGELETVHRLPQAAAADFISLL